MSRSAPLSVKAGGISYPVVWISATEFSVTSGNVPALDGVVDLYRGAMHLHQCLITGHALRGAEQVFRVKHATSYDYTASGETEGSAQAAV